MALEGPAEVALVREAGRESDRGKRLICGDKLLGGEIHPQLADVISQGRPAMAPESARQVDGVDSDRRRDFFVRQVLGEPVVKQFPDQSKPGWCASLWTAPPVARTFCQHLQCQAFHRQPGDIVIPQMFTVEPHCEPDRHSVAKLCRAVQNRGVCADLF